MQKSTGDIMSMQEAKSFADFLGKPFKEEFIKVDEKEMTKKQKINHSVSLHDHRSKLGVKLTKARKTGRNEKCNCGSNIKYKKCCINKK